MISILLNKGTQYCFVTPAHYVTAINRRFNDIILNEKPEMLQAASKIFPTCFFFGG